MVCLGAVLFAVVSLHCFGGVGDPGRVDAQVVTGIGFLGAGAIINQQGSVHSLTKAARLWFTEAIGLAVGVGMLLMSVMNEILVFLLLRLAPGQDGNLQVSRSEFFSNTISIEVRTGEVKTDDVSRNILGTNSGRNKPRNPPALVILGCGNIEKAERERT